ncbi:alpha/beta fold hydrolase [Botrimarina hoheduenensis]|uniref:Alpha/beta hydrolase family protein n=1 Tax=Botrimarina hoheduenensis TaxID=2528000 RepID=A0A5C5VSH8_9BACT|nr:alpha/beta hydrolase [Botrimarina hoheduenensis]TWT41584.1 Alpha/beta hydrolase family protein [Botrimarina hoheduenensis]
MTTNARRRIRRFPARLGVALSTGAFFGFVIGGAIASGDIPPSQPVEVTTSDAITLQATFYPGIRGRESPVVVLLPDEKQSRSSLEPLALALQSPPDGGVPSAVLAVDLRGQGDSRAKEVSGTTRRTNGRVEIAKMVKIDMEAVRAWLVTQNDKGRVNLNRLAYVGVGMGAVVALNAAAIDWSVPDLASSKQGRDVKAVVLISPPWRHSGLGVLDALRQPGVRSEVALLMMYGSQDRAQQQTVTRILNELERPRGAAGAASDDPLSSLVSASSETKQSGAALLKAGGERATLLVSRFLDQHVAQADAAWVQRRLE